MTDPGYRRYRPAPPSPAWAAYCELAPRLAELVEREGTLAAAIAVTALAKTDPPPRPRRWAWMRRSR